MTTYDILALTATQLANRGVVVSFTDGAAGGLAATGLLKLSQRYLLRLFTHRGSIAGHPDEGTTLLADALSGRVRTASDLRAAWALADHYVKQSFARDETIGVPADEQLVDAKLVTCQMSGGVGQLAIEIISQAGETARFFPPITLG